MPPRYARIPPIEITSDTADVQPVIDAVNDRIAEINRVLTELEVAESVTRGEDGTSPVIGANLDMDGNRIINLRRSASPTDAVTRQELQDIGILGNPGGEVTFSVPVGFSSGIINLGPLGGGSGQLLTTDDVQTLIEQALGAAVATSRDGELVTIEDKVGVNGRTEGTLAMARDGITGKARHLQAENGRLVVIDVGSTQLLSELVDICLLYTSDAADD